MSWSWVEGRIYNLKADKHLSIDTDLWRRVKTRAIQKNMTELVSQLLREGLNTRSIPPKNFGVSDVLSLQLGASRVDVRTNR